MRLLGDYESQAAVYVRWLRVAPQDHPKRLEVLSALRHARDVVAQYKKFSDLLGRGFSKDARDEATGWTDLHYAAVLDLPAVAAALVDSGIEADTRLKEGSVRLGGDLKRTLGEFGYGKRFVDWKAKGETPLMIAAVVNADHAAAELITRGAALDARGRQDWTPLHYAASSNARETAEVLARRGADLHAGNEDGASPLHHAALRNAVDTAEYLLDRGAEVDAKNKYDATPLHYAAWRNSLEGCRVAHRARRDPSCERHGGWLDAIASCSACGLPRDRGRCCCGRGNGVRQGPGAVVGRRRGARADAGHEPLMRLEE